MAALEVEIRKQYRGGPDSAAFELAVSFAAEDEITVLFGPSGSGKTMTLASVAGFVRPDAGSIRLQGETLFDSSRGIHLPARARRCGYVFQRDALFPHMTLRQNLEFAAAALPKDQSRIPDILENFRLTALAARRPRELSGGERQRGSIARALVAKPRFLLLDEPARGLDIGLRRQLYAVLRDVRDGYKLPMLLVTHDLDEAFELGGRMIVYHQGRIVQQGRPSEVHQQPATPIVAQLLGLPNVFDGKILELDAARDLTRLSTEDFELCTSFLNDRAVGDRVQFCVRPGRVDAAPRNGALKDGEIALPLRDSIVLGDQVRLEFSGSVSANVSRSSFEQTCGAREWRLAFPKDSVWVFPKPS